MAAFGNFFGGMIFALVKGPLMTVAIVGMVPPIIVTIYFSLLMMRHSSSEFLKAYSQSKGFAEQALSSIKVVMAYGQEKMEIKHYIEHLERGRVYETKEKMVIGAGTAVFMTVCYLSYCWAFWIGSIIVTDEHINGNFDRPYNYSDVFGIYFIVLISFSGLGGSGPAMNGIAEAQIAGKRAFDIIDRIPSIDLNDEEAVEHQVEGECEFKNVSFAYPMNPDKLILDDFSCKFEKGKSYSIVGPVGSGRSTVVQLLERFYDPDSGELTIDDKSFSAIKIDHFRQQVGYVPSNPVLFGTTLKQNMRLAKKTATDEEIIDVLKKVNAYEFVLEKENGINC
jgi:ATP-binding cassette, subfamily B (MDR/TAP), member 1